MGMGRAVAGSADSCSCSTELMRRVRRFQLAQYRCLLVKYAKDTRYCTTGVSTHDRWAMGRRTRARGHVAGLPGSPSPSLPLRNTMEARPACALQDVYQEALGSAVIGIDEGQFVSVWPGQGLGHALLRRGAEHCPFFLLKLLFLYLL